MMLRAAFALPDPVVEDLRRVAGRLSVLPGVRPSQAVGLDVHVADLGNIVADDARALAGAVGRQFARTASPVLRATGIEVSARGSVALTLGGDVDALREMARAVGLAAERINLYVDRRMFRPAVVVASVGEQRPGSRVVATLEAIEPPATGDWSISELVLVRTRWGASGAALEVFERVPIGTGSGATSDVGLASGE